jgi:glycosyltransferase involved in cell wall biosynthesis
MEKTTANRIPISATIICKNAQHHITEVLEALKQCDEILVADTGSSDQTIEIVKQFSNVRCISLEFIGFGPTKNKAIENAAHDWILSVDADEVVNASCVEACIQKIQSVSPNHVGRILRNNFALGQKIHYSGWGNDRIIRLFNRKHTAFSEAAVHESVVIQADTVVLNISGAIDHFTVNSLDDFFSKTQLYTSLRTPPKASLKISLTRAFIAAFLRFVKTYFLQRGLLDGRLGFIIAAANAQSVFWRYARQVNFNENKNRKDT